ncbi:diacylglycerol kinase family protein [Pelagerythrobacter marensis]|uniref:Diacylglycerol kinase family protein n=1 Tax=Pelagerythrobacter marensis TaxID=543877 RepID=A0ABZ2D4X7_9SPHN
MNTTRALWLVVNSASGNNNPAAIEALESCCDQYGLTLARRIDFPDQPLPDAATLDAAGVDTLAVYAGDGTINATVTGLYGWRGAILVLPGGTMNLLAQRLHGDATSEEILLRAGRGAARRVRPDIARTAHGDALAGLLAGPGTSWYAVREAMRDADIAAMADSAGEALAETTGGSMLRCRDPQIGRDDGYPLIEFTPGPWGMQVDAYHAENAGEFLQQGWALLRRQFREGPHDRLGLLDRIVVADSESRSIGLLIDGEPAQGQAREEFVMAACEVDLLATGHGG